MGVDDKEAETWKRARDGPRDQMRWADATLKENPKKGGMTDPEMGPAARRKGPRMRIKVP